MMLLGLQSHKILFLRYCDAKVSCGNFTIIIFDILIYGMFIIIGIYTLDVLIIKHM